ncbi:MAG: HigA family addiction module antidote protein [Tannerella sp.]|jgi:addiction module HigA family antidote|nr:HigA family addiction module antidote protein [Tannerella sp.]
MGNLGEPFRAYHPGELMKEELECRGISQHKFAEGIGLSYTILNEILNGKRPISTDVAMLFEAALGVDAGLLVRMQTSYNLQVARKDKKLLARLDKVRKVAAAL